MNPETTAFNPDPTTGNKPTWPEWLWTTDRNDLPDSLDWGDDDRPLHIGGSCDYYRDGKHVAGCLPTHYFHVAGVLYVVVTVHNKLIEAYKLLPGDQLILRHDDTGIRRNYDDEKYLWQVEVPPTYEERAARYKYNLELQEQKMAAAGYGKDGNLPF
ncbi:hypothetical protein [Hymenobacter sp. UYCo722]|uniref:hypothetical protein n=1 Tax=Hymenobacter sp. UYCo722 TaxID=3156335 RepID=UPI0033970BBF